MGSHSVKPLSMEEVRERWQDVSKRDTVSEEEFKQICGDVYHRTAPEAYLPDKLVDMWFQELHEHLKVAWTDFYRLYQILVENAGAPLAEYDDITGIRGHFKDDVGVCDIRHLEGNVDPNYSYAVSRFQKFESPLEGSSDFKRTLGDGKSSEFIKEFRRDLQGIRFSFRNAPQNVSGAADWDNFRDGLSNAMQLGEDIIRDIESCQRPEFD